MSTATPAAGPEGETSAGLEIDGINKSFGDKQVLRDVAFRIPAGRTVGFVGNNGAGKSTTMRIVLGLTSLDSGTIRYQGRPIDVSARKRIGYMPEERGLYPQMRVSEQLVYLGLLSGYSKTESADAAEHWTGRLGLEKARRSRLSELSLGNQQRVQLAAALLHAPQLLILDEPFSGLDPSAVAVMSDVLKEQAAQGKPVLFSSHQLDLVERLCDQVVIISDGRIVADGSVSELRQGASLRYRVVADGLTEGWTAPIPGARELSWHEGSCSVEIKDGQDQELLAAARTWGPVREFTPVRPDLAELYRDVVSARDVDGA
ncbi:ATP-binding cassette domain-containing protein [Streptomyces cyaneofuscatus]|uniref:ABC transporter ATP-binding protein n=1 Tax=Streptomyces cyaneofuscatus TaxID=66883 RepID=UPI003329424B